MQPVPRSIYRAAAGAFTLFAVGMQYWLLVRDESIGEAVATSLKFFSFFTILANLLAAAALLVPLAAEQSAMAVFLQRPSVRTAIAGYMMMVGAVYYLLLVGVSGRTGWPLVFEHMLHAVTPPLFVLDWLLFVDKRTLDWRLGPRALAFPLAYAGFTLARGAATGWYPYPFIDVNDLGYARVLATIIVLVAAFFAVVAALAIVGRRLGSSVE